MLFHFANVRVLPVHLSQQIRELRSYARIEDDILLLEMNRRQAPNVPDGCLCLRNQFRTGSPQNCQQAIKVRFHLAVVLSEVVTGRGDGHGASSKSSPPSSLSARTAMPATAFWITLCSASSILTGAAPLI